MEEKIGEITFKIKHLYIKDLSFELPHVAFEIFKDSKILQMDVKVSVLHTKISEEDFEVILDLELKGYKEEKIIFILEAKYAGLFLIKKIPLNHIEFFLEVNCASIIFPYLRELVSDILNKAGFSQFILAPINFNLLFHQKKEEKQVNGG